MTISSEEAVIAEREHKEMAEIELLNAMERTEIFIPLLGKIIKRDNKLLCLFGDGEIREAEIIFKLKK